MKERIIHRPTISEFKRMAVQLGYVKVVRCKDCQYYDKNFDGFQEDFCRWAGKENPAEDDFCSFGKKIKEE